MKDWIYFNTIDNCWHPSSEKYCIVVEDDETIPHDGEEVT